MGSAADVSAISNIYINTNLAAAGGVVVAIILTMLFYKKTDLTMALNGALGGLVAITAEPLAPSPMLAIFIGAQLYGILAIGAFTVIASSIVWYAIKLIIGIRVSEEQELEGVDVSEVGMEAYPDFKK
jgi:Amt family ammonium transporter